MSMKPTKHSNPSPMRSYIERAEESISVSDQFTDKLEARLFTELDTQQPLEQPERTGWAWLWRWFALGSAGTALAALAVVAWLGTTGFTNSEVTVAYPEYVLPHAPLQVYTVSGVYSNELVSKVGTDYTVWFHEAGVRVDTASAVEYRSELYLADDRTYCVYWKDVAGTSEPDCEINRTDINLYPNRLVQVAWQAPDELLQLVNPYRQAGTSVVNVPLDEETSKWFADNTTIDTIAEYYEQAKSDLHDEQINLESELATIEERVADLQTVVNESDLDKNSAAQSGRNVLQDLYTQQDTVEQKLEDIANQVIDIDNTLQVQSVQFQFDETTGSLQQYSFRNAAGASLYSVTITQEPSDEYIWEDVFNEVQWKQEVAGN